MNIKTPVDNSLQTLAERVNSEHQLARAHARSAVEHAVACGELLIEAKARLEHGQFQIWLAQHTEVADRTARAYMLAARRLPELDPAKRQRVATLPLRMALRELAERGPSPALTAPSAPAVKGPAQQHWDDQLDASDREWRERFQTVCEERNRPALVGLMLDHAPYLRRFRLLLIGEGVQGPYLEERLIEFEAALSEGMGQTLFLGTHLPIDVLIELWRIEVRVMRTELGKDYAAWADDFIAYTRDLQAAFTLAYESYDRTEGDRP